MLQTDPKEGFKSEEKSFEETPQSLAWQDPVEK